VLSVGTGFPAPWLKKQEAKALAVIQDWLEVCQGQVYCSVSGGKDSLVAADLICQVYPACPLVWVNQGPLAEWPDCVELLEHWRTQGRNLIELCPVRSLWHLYLDLGIPLEGTMATAADKLINKRLMYDPLDEYQELHGIRGYAWGLRKESRGRAAYLKTHGLLHHRKNGLWICSPVGFWTTEQIWQYIDRHRLPYPAMYDRDRATVRNGPPIGTTGVNWGRLAELRRHHPEIWQQFSSQFPEVRDHA